MTVKVVREDEEEYEDAPRPRRRGARARARSAKSSKSKKSNTMLWIGIGAVVVTGAYILYQRQNQVAANPAGPGFAGAPQPFSPDFHTFAQLQEPEETKADQAARFRYAKILDDHKVMSGHEALGMSLEDLRAHAQMAKMGNP